MAGWEFELRFLLIRMQVQKSNPSLDKAKLSLPDLPPHRHTKPEQSLHIQSYWSSHILCVDRDMLGYGGLEMNRGERMQGKR